ncbi:hypothetical protein LTR86_010403 [Recurvomyces mirabilis]|nr:hypothetical protein LTR86_010403 [Recurvomyces mirabilis]
MPQFKDQCDLVSEPTSELLRCIQDALFSGVTSAGDGLITNIQWQPGLEQQDITQGGAKRHSFEDMCKPLGYDRRKFLYDDMYNVIAGGVSADRNPHSSNLVKRSRGQDHPGKTLRTVPSLAVLNGALFDISVPPITTASQDCMRFCMLLAGTRLPVIRKAFLMRALRGQSFWNEQGHHARLQFKDAGIRVSSAFASEAALDDLLQQGVDHGLLALPEDGNVWTVVHNEKWAVNHHCVLESSDGLALLCFLAPRDEAGDSIVHDDLAGLVTQLGIDTLPPHLDLMFTKVRSVMLRQRCLYLESDRILQQKIKTTELCDVRTTCQVSQLYLSMAENAILQNQFRKACGYADKVLAPEPGMKPTEMELRLGRQKYTVKGRLLRFEGRFEEAKNALTVCFQICSAHDFASMHHVRRHLADVYCELLDPAKAQQLLEDGLRSLDSRQNSRSPMRRRILISLATALTRLGRYQEAKSHLADVRSQYESHPPANPTDELDHFHTTAQLMTIAARDENYVWSLHYATDALALAQRYTSFAPNNYYRGFVLRYRAMLYKALANEELSHKDHLAATGCVQDKRHFIAGFGTWEVDWLHSRCSWQ